MALIVWSWALIALAVIGALDALYFVLVDQRKIRPDPRWLPPVCRMEEDTCMRILDTPYARVFGLTNATYGLVWYVLLAALATWALITGELLLCVGLLVVAAGTVLLAVYLIWALLVKLETICPLCLLGHAVNASILGVLWLAC